MILGGGGGGASPPFLSRWLIRSGFGVSQVPISRPIKDFFLNFEFSKLWPLEAALVRTHPRILVSSYSVSSCNRNDRPLFRRFEPFCR